MALVYLDTNVFIQAFESRLAIAQPVRDLLALLERHPGSGVTSELTIAELLAPAKASDALTVSEKLRLYETFFDGGFVALVPVSRWILRETAPLREAYPQKLPDAIHVVTAVQENCRFLMSSDRDAKRVPTLIAGLKPDHAGLETIRQALHD